MYGAIAGNSRSVYVILLCIYGDTGIEYVLERRVAAKTTSAGGALGSIDDAYRSSL